MAYLAFDEHALAPAPAAVSRAVAPVADPAPRLSGLEWSVVALARTDRLSTLRRPGRMATALRVVFNQHNPMLADERLEALRRMAVLSWHRGADVPARERDAFFAAGFSPAQHGLLLSSIAAARAAQEARR